MPPDGQRRERACLGHVLGVEVDVPSAAQPSSERVDDDHSPAHRGPTRPVAISTVITASTHGRPVVGERDQHPVDTTRKAR